MATTVHGTPPEDRVMQGTSTSDEQVIAGHPTEQLEVEEAQATEDNFVYPTGVKVWLTMISMCVAYFLNGLDLTIVAVAVPPLTDYFGTVADIGWYSAAEGLTASAFVFFFGKAYQVYTTKQVFLFGLITFEIGSLICTFAPSSRVFIIGRAIIGIGSSAEGGGILKILKNSFPMSKQPLMVGIAGLSQSVGLVAAPLLGGVLIDTFSWRACFGVNLPIGVLCIAFTAYAFTDPVHNPEADLPWKEKVKRMDLFSTVLVVPAITCLLMALQWGGIKFGWKDPRIIVLFVLFGVLFSGFCYYQYACGENATIPPRLLKNRTVIGTMWVGACLNGILAMTEYYMSIYYQGVRGYTPTKSGLLGLPMIAGLMVASLIFATGTTAIGHYFPFLFATSILAPIASGLLTTVDLDGDIVKPTALLGFLGIAVGLAIQCPMLALQNTLSSKDISMGGALLIFCGGLGSALWICISATMFQNRLGVEIHKYSPSTNVTTLESVGLSQIREYVGSENLKTVLSGYNEAVVETLYLPLGLTILVIVGSLMIERKSVKKKHQ